MSSSDDSKQSVPASLLLDFFHRSTEKLNLHALESCRTSTVEPEPSLEELRNRLLEIQIETLRHVVDDYNASANKDQDAAPMTIESAQVALRKIGEATQVGDRLYQPMQDMNDAARLAFVRNALNAYAPYLDPNFQSHEIKVFSERVDRKEILEFLGLVTIAVKLDEVQRYLQTGSPIQFNRKETASTDHVLQVSSQSIATETTHEKRLALLQSAVLRAVLGHPVADPFIILKEVNRLLSTEESDAQTANEELSQAFENYMSATRVAITNAEAPTKLADYDQGGVTRVVSVTYSEKTIGMNGIATGAPSQTFMEQQKELEQCKELRMARRAAEMQQTLLAQLLMMGEDEREYVLRDAKETHDIFLREARAIPPGPKRVIFMQSIEEEKQKKLIMHKLWESTLAEHGGKPPTIHIPRCT